VESKQLKDLAEVIVKQLEYFRCWDRKINKMQKGLVNAISGLFQIMGMALVGSASSRPPMPPPRDVPLSDAPQSHGNPNFPSAAAGLQTDGKAPTLGAVRRTAGSSSSLEESN
jgi:hypothetical protein